MFNEAAPAPGAAEGRLTLIYIDLDEHVLKRHVVSEHEMTCLGDILQRCRDMLRHMTTFRQYVFQKVKTYDMS